jgi:hypothetical protein
MGSSPPDVLGFPTEESSSLPAVSARAVSKCKFQTAKPQAKSGQLSSHCPSALAIPPVERSTEAFPTRRDVRNNNSLPLSDRGEQSDFSKPVHIPSLENSPRPTSNSEDFDIEVVPDSQGEEDELHSPATIRRMQIKEMLDTAAAARRAAALAKRREAWKAQKLRRKGIPAIPPSTARLPSADPEHQEPVYPMAEFCYLSLSDEDSQAGDDERDDPQDQNKEHEGEEKPMEEGFQFQDDSDDDLEPAGDSEMREEEAEKFQQSAENPVPAAGDRVSPDLTGREDLDPNHWLWGENSEEERDRLRNPTTTTTGVGGSTEQDQDYMNPTGGDGLGGPEPDDPFAFIPLHPAPGGVSESRKRVLSSPQQGEF